MIEDRWFKILWNFKIQCYHKTEYRRPDIIVVEKKQNQCVAVDIASSGDSRGKKKNSKRLVITRNYRQKFRAIKISIQ